MLVLASVIYSSSLCRSHPHNQPYLSSALVTFHHSSLHCHLQGLPSLQWMACTCALKMGGAVHALEQLVLGLSEKYTDFHVSTSIVTGLWIVQSNLYFLKTCCGQICLWEMCQSCKGWRQISSYLQTTQETKSKSGPSAWLDATKV